MAPQSLDQDELAILRQIPSLAGKFRKTSDKTDDYNCLAWALGSQRPWIDPYDHRITPGKWWPPGIPEDWSISATRQIFEQDGYSEETDIQSLEPGWEKVAIFSNSRGELHFSRQLSSGKWTSKLGQHIDIEHDDLDCLQGNIYGQWRLILRRRSGSRPPFLTP